MKLISSLFLIICILSFQNSFGQNNDLEVFTVVENMPIFNYEICAAKGNKKAIYECSKESFDEYIKNVHFPEDALFKGMSGKVFVNFAIKEDSSIVILDIIKSSGYELLDSAAVAHLQNMPKWIPGNQRAIKAAVMQTAKFDFYIH